MNDESPAVGSSPVEDEEPVPVAPTAPLGGGGGSLEQLQGRVAELEEILRQQIVRLYAMEQRLADRPGPALRVPTAMPERPAGEAPTASPVERSPREATPRQGRGLGWEQLERVIGGNWFNRIGMVAVILSIGFFLKYAIEHQWMGPLARVLLAGAGGAALLVWGERMARRGYRHYGQGLSGGGIAILYLTIQAASVLYGLIGAQAAFLLMTGVTILSVLLSVRNDALAMAVLGLIGGFLTPLLLSTGEENRTVLFSYLLLLDLGVLAVAHWRRWPVLAWLAFGGTVFVSGAWWVTWCAPEKFAETLLFFTLLFLVFAFVPVVSILARRSAASQWDGLLLFANGGTYGLALHELLAADHSGWQGTMAVVLGFFHFGLGRLVRRWEESGDRYLQRALTGLAVLCWTVALPIQWDQQWVTIGWAVEGAVLAVLGWSTGRRLTRVAAGLVLLIAAAHWIGIDLSAAAYSTGEEAPFTPIFNLRGGSMAALLVSLLTAAWAVRRWPSTPPLTIQDRWEGDLWKGLPLLSAVLLATLWLSLETTDYFDQRIDQFRVLLDPLWDTQEGTLWLETWKRGLLSLLWSLSGGGLLIAGIVGGRRLPRLIGAGLLVSAGGILLGHGGHGTLAAWQWPLLNPLFAAFAGLATALLLAYRAGRRHPERRMHWEGRVLPPALLTLSQLVLLGGLRFEVQGPLLARLEALSLFPAFDAVLGRELLLSVLYALQAGAMIGIGIGRADRWLRALGLGLMLATIVKVFFFDLSGLGQLYRIFSFLVLGATLLLISYLYQRHQRREAAPADPR
ncbi:MAG: DUF2339 domain-containing protein [Blastocatellia bacterium]